MSLGKKMLVLNLTILVGTVALWVVAFVAGWLSSVEFVSHISMAALVLASLSSIVAALAEMEAED